MKTILCRNQRNSLLVTFAQTTILSLILLGAQDIWALPRPPLPPMPGPTPIDSQVFDDLYYAGQTASEIVIPGVGTMEQSWSGYALQRMGDVIPFVVPAVDSIGHTNVSCDTTGAFRFWMNPYWTSGSITNGNTPGTTVTVLELNAVNGTQSAVAWSLQISADGNTMRLWSQGGAGPQEVLQAPISWLAGTSHNVVLDFGPQGSVLFLDGIIVAQGSSLPSIPPSVGQLVIGSTLAGNNSAGADFDEFYSFAGPLTTSDVGQYWTMTSAQAVLGPLPDLPQGQRMRHGPFAPAQLSPVYDPDRDTGCPTGGNPYLTNFFASFMPNGTTTITFDVAGGTNGVFYDIYFLTNISASLDQSHWIWAGEGLTCNTYTITNQPPNYAFYFIIPPVQLSVIAWGDNSFGQCNVPLGITNPASVAAGGFFSLILQSNGTIVAWGDNSYGQTNVPAGITNAASLAAGQYHALALLSNGCVRSWGYYSDGSNFYSVTNYPGLSGPPTSNVMAIAAGIGHDLALMSNGTVTAWGLTNLYATTPDALAFQSNLTGVKSVACGWNHNVVILSNGVVQAWGLNASKLWKLTNVPSGLTNVVAIAAGPLHSVAFSADGTVKTWGYIDNGETNDLSAVSDVVAIAAGSDQSLALEANGTFLAWGMSTFPAATVPTNLFGVKAIASGFAHNLAIASSTLPPLRTEPPTGFAAYGQSFTFSVVGVYAANVQYQWQFNGTNLTGQTNATLTLTSTSAFDNGNYQVVISNASGTATSLAATFTLALPPQINSTTPGAPSTNWINYVPTLSVEATAVGQTNYPLSYQWQFNGTNIADATNSSYTIPGLAPPVGTYGGYTVPTNEGNYTVIVSNALGSTNATWTEVLAVPGIVNAWGADDSGECDRPAWLTNVEDIAAGEYQSIAVTDSGTVVQWGQYWDYYDFYSVTNTNYVSLPPTSNVVAVAAGLTQALALMNDGTVRAWGLDGAYGTEVPPGLSNVIAIACGWEFNVALLANGTVTSWGDNYFGQTNVPAGLTNVIAIAAGAQHTLALLANGTIQAWGDGFDGDTNIPPGLSNVVAIAAGETHNLALLATGHVVAWGYNGSGQTNVPAGLSNVMAIAAGDAHSVALKNDSTLVEWGDNSSGQALVPAKITNIVITTDNNVSPPFIQTNTYPAINVKLIAAGGDHTLAAIFSPLVQYPVDVSKDLLLIYNTNSLDSSNVCQYYLTHRPMVSNANVLGIGVTTNDPIWPPDFTNIFLPQVRTWLSNNPTKRPLYVVLFQDVPQEVDWSTNSPDSANDGAPSVQYQLHYSTAPGWYPYVSAINMNGRSGTNFNSSDGTNDCIAYINKLVSMASNNPQGTLFITASEGGYNNTDWYFDYSDPPAIGSFAFFATNAEYGVTNVDPMAAVFGTPFDNFTSRATNVAGYFTPGADETGDGDMFVNGRVQFFGESGWYIMTTIDSFDGQRVTSQANYLTWFSNNAFGGTNYSNTPVGAVTTVDEPGVQGKVDPTVYYGQWAVGKSFAISAWAAQELGNGIPGIVCFYFQAVGDPFVRK